MFSRFSRVGCSAAFVLVLGCMFLPHADAQDDEVTPQVQQLYAEAHQAQASGDTTLAMQKYRAMLRLAPHLAPAYNNLGMLQFNAHMYPDAAATLSKGLALNPDMPSARAMLGLSYLEMGDATKAEAPLDAALRSKPDDDTVQMALARDRIQLGKLEPAAATLRDYLDRHPKDAQAWYLLGKTYLQLSGMALGKVNEVDPDSVFSHEVSGEIDQSMHNYDGALVEFRKAVAMAPTEAGTHLHVADALWEQGKWTEAEPEFTAELANDPHNCNAQWRLGDSMLQANADPTEALKPIDAAIQQCPGLAQARVDRARALVKLHRASEALPDLLVAVKDSPNEPSIHYLLGQVYRSQGKTAESAQEMQTFARLTQAESDAQARQAGDAMRTGDAH